MSNNVTAYMQVNFVFTFEILDLTSLLIPSIFVNHHVGCITPRSNK